MVAVRHGGRVPPRRDSLITESNDRLEHVHLTPGALVKRGHEQTLSAGGQVLGKDALPAIHNDIQDFSDVLRRFRSAPLEGLDVLADHLRGVEADLGTHGDLVSGNQGAEDAIGPARAGAVTKAGAERAE